MTRNELNELLKLYASGAYWHGEDTGKYGYPDPEIHEEVELKIWNAIAPNKPPGRNMRLFGSQLGRNMRLFGSQLGEDGP